MIDLKSEDRIVVYEDVLFEGHIPRSLVARVTPSAPQRLFEGVYMHSVRCHSGDHDSARAYASLFASYVDFTPIRVIDAAQVEGTATRVIDITEYVHAELVQRTRTTLSG